MKKKVLLIIGFLFLYSTSVWAADCDGTVASDSSSTVYTCADNDSLTVGLGGGIYLVANLGPGPRDGLMIGLQQKTNFPIATVRAFIEISVVSIGWYLGGTVGVGTLLFAFGIGPAVALGLFLVDKIFN